MTNSSLITVFNGTIATQSVQLANARDLHLFLGSDRQFANWITDRITDYGFVQDEDYIIVTERTNGRPRKEYHITLDMGKELAMVERNEKGRQVRKYFIECERKMKKLLQNNQQTATLAIEHKIEQPQPLSDSELYTLVKVWREVETMRYWLNALQEPLKWLKSPYVDDVLEAQTFRSDIEDFRNIVIKYSGHIQKSLSPNNTMTPFEQAILDLRKKWLRLNTGREIIQPIF